RPRLRRRLCIPRLVHCPRSHRMGTIAEAERCPIGGRSPTVQRVGDSLTTGPPGVIAARERDAGMRDVPRCVSGGADDADTHRRCDVVGVHRRAVRQLRVALAVCHHPLPPAVPEIAIDVFGQLTMVMVWLYDALE